MCDACECVCVRVSVCVGMEPRVSCKLGKIMWNETQYLSPYFMWKLHPPLKDPSSLTNDHIFLPYTPLMEFTSHADFLTVPKLAFLSKTLCSSTGFSLHLDTTF